MNHHRMAAAIGAITLGIVAVMATASAAQAAGVHGCPGGDVCLYNSTAQYTNGNPAVVDGVGKAGVFFGGTFDLIAVNNTAALYSSEGFIESKFLHGVLVLCEYVPDTSDVQSPGTTENPADDELTGAIATGSTLDSVNAPKVLPLTDCSGS